MAHAANVRLSVCTKEKGMGRTMRLMLRIHFLTQERARIVCRLLAFPCTLKAPRRNSLTE